MRNDGFSLKRLDGSGAGEIPRRLLKCLNENRVCYEILHQPNKLSSRKSQSRTARYYTQVMVVRAGPQHLLAVLPANARIDLNGFAGVGEPVRLETEEEFKWLFPDCVGGAVPPFGQLYGLPTFVDAAVSETGFIIFAAGTDSDYIKISYPVYERIVQPRIGFFSIKTV